MEGQNNGPIWQNYNTCIVPPQFDGKHSNYTALSVVFMINIVNMCFIIKRWQYKSCGLNSFFLNMGKVTYVQRQAFITIHKSLKHI